MKEEAPETLHIDCPELWLRRNADDATNGRFTEH